MTQQNVLSLPRNSVRRDEVEPRARLPISRDALSRRRIAHRRAEGMTLIEIMIVVVIMALIATGVGIAVIPQLQKAKVQQTESAVEAVRSAVQIYIATNNAECATIDQLVEDKILDKSKARTDAWDREFRVECDGTEITVTSAGPDGEFDTEDDIK